MSNGLRKQRNITAAAAGSALVLVCVFSSGARAASATWTGGTSSTWAGTGNWTATPVPGSADTATFSSISNSNTTIDLGGGVTVLNLVFDGGNAAAYTIGSGGVGSQTFSINSSAGRVLMGGSVLNNELINANLHLDNTNSNTNSTVTNNSLVGTLTLAGSVAPGANGVKTVQFGGAGNGFVTGGIVNNTGSFRITKSGTGTWTLSGNNTTTGTILSIGNGTMVLDYANAPTGNSSNYILNAAMNVDVSGGSNSGTLKLLGKTGAGNFTTQTFAGISGTNDNGLFTVQLNANGGDGVKAIFASTAGGSNNSRVLFDESANTAAGSVTTTTANNSSGFLDNNFIIDSTGRADFATNSSGTVVALNAATPFSSTATTAATNYQLNGSQTQTGNVGTNSGGSLRITTSGAGQSLNLGNFNYTGPILFAGTNDYTISGTGTLGVGSFNLYQFSTKVLTLKATLASSNGTTNFYGEGGLVDWNSATGSTPNNTSTGLFTVSGLTVRLSYSGANSINLTNSGSGLTSGWGRGTGYINIDNGGILELAAADLTRDIGTGPGQLRMVVNGGFSAFGANHFVALNGGAALKWNDSTNTSFLNGDGSLLILGSAYSNATIDFRNPLDLNGGNRQVQINNGVSSTDVDALMSGVLSDSIGSGGMLSKTGTGTLALTAANSYTGPTYILAGQLNLGNGGASGSVAGDIRNTGILGFNRTDTLNYGGSITGTGSVAQFGSGTTVLSGSSSYTGATNITAGKLIVNGNITTSSGVSVAAGATIGGNGSIAATTVAGTTSVIAPGSVTSPGTLTMAALNADTGADMQFRLGPTSGSPASDQLVITGTFSDSASGIGNLVLDLSGTGGSSPVTGVTYTLITFGSGANITDTDFSLGTHAGLTLLTTGLSGTDSDGDGIYLNGNSVQVTFSAVPEPTCVSLLALGTAGLLARRSRRHRASTAGKN